MKALWTLREATVHSIRSQFFSQRPLAYTTVMTVMDRLARKGIVEREKRGRAHVYRPLVSDVEVREHALDRLLNNFFRGSRDRLRQHLEGHDPEERERPAPEEGPAALVSRDESSPRAATAETIDPSLL